MKKLLTIASAVVVATSFAATSASAGGFKGKRYSPAKTYAKARAVNELYSIDRRCGCNRDAKIHVFDQTSVAYTTKFRTKYGYGKKAVSSNSLHAQIWGPSTGFYLKTTAKAGTKSGFKRKRPGNNIPKLPQ